MGFKVSTPLTSTHSTMTLDTCTSNSSIPDISNPHCNISTTRTRTGNTSTLSTRTSSTLTPNNSIPTVGTLSVGLTGQLWVC